MRHEPRLNREEERLQIYSELEVIHRKHYGWIPSLDNGFLNDVVDMILKRESKR